MIKTKIQNKKKIKCNTDDDVCKTCGHKRKEHYFNKNKHSYTYCMHTACPVCLKFKFSGHRFQL